MNKINSLIFIQILLILTGCCFNTNVQKTSFPLPMVNTISLKDDILIVDDDPHGILNSLNQMIQEEVNVDIVHLDEKTSIDLSSYQTILIGSVPRDNDPSDLIESFITNNDLTNKNVSFYYIGAYDNEMYEKKLASLNKEMNYIEGIGFNSDEISEVEIIEEFIDLWLTSLYIDA